MTEDQSFEPMPCFTWTIEDIVSTQKLKSPIFTVLDVKFHMLYQRYDGLSSLSMVPEVENPQSTIPSYDIKTSISIMNPVKSFKNFRFIHKTTNRNNTGREECHLLWKIETKYLDNSDILEEINGKHNMTFLCVFGPLCQYQKEVADFESDWCEGLCMQRLGKDLDELRLNDYSSLVLKCGNKIINAHEVILSARSEKFAAMFRNKSTTVQEVEIKDMEFEVLENLITYIYSGRLKDGRPSVELLKQLYETAVLYKVETLKVMTSSKLVEILNNSDSTTKLEILPKAMSSGSTDIMDKKRLSDLSLELLSMADQHKDESFKASIINCIVGNIDFILTEETWKEFRKNNETLAMEVYDVFVNVV